MSVKSIMFASASLLGVSMLPADSTCRPLNSFEQGSGLRLGQRVAGYNATARTDVRGSWDIYTTASYILWQPREDNLELGIIDTANPASGMLVGNVIGTHYHYRSGIKAGLGVYSSWDNWDVYGEYTWFSSRQDRSSTPKLGIVAPFGGHPFNVPILPSKISSASSRWNLELNIADLQLARSYFVGSKLVFRPFFAARAAWINQSYHIAYLVQGSTTPYHICNASHSWGVGPEIGVSTEWRLGAGIRVIGMAEVDTLFTRYNLHAIEQKWSDPSTKVLNISEHHLYCLRPHSDLEMGLGWETYFNNHNYHLDLSATYGFQVFWSQNMFRNYVDSNDFAKSYLPNGDLYIHGLTANLRFDF